MIAQCAMPLLITKARLTVMIAIRIGLLVFKPQQTQGNPLADIFHVGKTPFLGKFRWA